MRVLVQACGAKAAAVAVAVVLTLAAWRSALTWSGRVGQGQVGAERWHEREKSVGGPRVGALWVRLRSTALLAACETWRTVPLRSQDSEGLVEASACGGEWCCATLTDFRDSAYVFLARSTPMLTQEGLRHTVRVARVAVP
jgi:hypothetical protein